MFWSNPKDVDTQDRYGVVVDKGWLLDETVTAFTFTVDADSGLSVIDPYIDDNICSAIFQGGVEGFHKIHIRIETQTRSLERCVSLWVNDGCK